MTTTDFGGGADRFGAGHAPRPGNGRPPSLAAEVGKPIGVLFREVLDKTRALLREELRLAKAEMREQLELVGRNLTWISVGAGLALASILILCIALNRGLTVLFAQFLDPEIAVWLVPLLLGLVLAAIGAALIMKGVKTLREHLNLVPEKTKQTLKEDREWLRQKVT
jgi:uncharacterized integral membrane protein